MEAITREEKLMSAASSGKSSGIKPITREEMFLSYIAGESNKKPKPITRKEMFLDKIEKGEGGGTSGGGDIVPILEGTIEEITIPNEVTKLRNGAFVGCDTLKKINADESHEVYASADGILYTKDGKKLISYPPAKEGTEYTLPDSVEEITTYAFNNTKNIEKIILGKGIKSIAENIAVENEDVEITLVAGGDTLAQGGVYPLNSDKVNTVILPEEKVFVSATAFDNMPNIETVYYNADYDLEIKEYYDEWDDVTYPFCFVGYLSNLKKIIISDEVTEIPKRFINPYYADNIETLIIGDGTERIGDHAFSNLSNLKDFKLGNNIKYIGCCAFSGSNITGTLVIPDSVEEIGIKENEYDPSSRTFQNTKIDELIIGKGLTKLPPYIFSGCENLKSVVIPGNVKIVEEYAFEWCANISLIELEEGVETIKASAFYGCGENSTLDVYIPRSVNLIGETVFCASWVTPTYVTIHGYAGSYAETWATEKGITFVPIEE
jgi:hypothetical protein